MALVYSLQGDGTFEYIFKESFLLPVLTYSQNQLKLPLKQASTYQANPAGSLASLGMIKVKF